MKTEQNIQMILSASLATHGIDSEKGVLGSPFAADVGFINTPTEFTAGLEKFDACYVGETSDNIILAFRGTTIDIKEEPVKVIADWLNNLLAKPVTIEGIPGQLHEGFSSSIERLWKKKFQKEVQKRMENGKSLIITGNSKGAALSPIAAAFLVEKLKLDKERISLCFFEPPRPGDTKFAKYFNTNFPDTLRYEYQDDLVPHLPPIRIFSQLLAKIPELGEILEKYEDLDKWNYKSVGNLQFVNWDNEIVEDSVDVEIERIVHIYELIKKGELITMIKDHMPCGHIYNVIMGKDCPNQQNAIS